MGRNAEGKFNVAVGAMIENNETGKILLLRRNSNSDYAPGIWEEVTGRMKQFEEPMVAVKREVKEETGLSVRIIKPINIFHMSRGEKKKVNELIGIVYWVTTNSEKVKLSIEHDSFRWVSPKEALKIADHMGVKRDIRAFLKERIGHYK